MLLRNDFAQSITLMTCTGTDESATDKQVHSFFSIEYYQQFFNVDTSMVVERIASSIIPRKAPPSYLKQHIGLNPDLYGPFWIVVTLVSKDTFSHTAPLNTTDLSFLMSRKI